MLEQLKEWNAVDREASTKEGTETCAESCTESRTESRTETRRNRLRGMLAEVDRQEDASASATMTGSLEAPPLDLPEAVSSVSGGIVQMNAPAESATIAQGSGDVLGHHGKPTGEAASSALGAAGVVDFGLELDEHNLEDRRIARRLDGQDDEPLISQNLDLLAFKLTLDAKQAAPAVAPKGRGVRAAAISPHHDQGPQLGEISELGERSACAAAA